MFASWQGFEAGLAKLKASSFRDPETKVPLAPLCTPGKNTWDVLHNAAPWVWGAGGEIVRQAGGRWQSALNSPESLEGFTSSSPWPRRLRPGGEPGEEHRPD